MSRWDPGRGLGKTKKTPVRSCYDLDVHSKKTGVSMMASCQLDEPKTVTEYKLQTDRKTLGTTFKAQQKKARLDGDGTEGRCI